MTNENSPFLEVRNLRKYFPVESGFLRKVVGHVRAVDDVSFHIRKGEVLGLVGESGCGKTTVGRCILRAIEPDEGEIRFRFNEEPVDVAKLPRRALRRQRRYMQMIFQDPYSSLSPRKSVFDIVDEPLKVNNIGSFREREERAREVIRAVGLNVEHIKRYPHAFSGGQRQRIAIARALAPDPKFIVADESVSALDVSVRAEILNLMQDLKEEFDLTYLFIAHDLSVIQHISDRVAVMYVGRLVELAGSEELFAEPKHPYTEALISAIPTPDPQMKMERVLLKGEVPSPADPPSGCHFHPRCRYSEGECETDPPELREVSQDHFVACHRADDLSLQGVPE